MAITDQDLVIEAAEAGAAVVRLHFGSALTHFPKSAGDFATTADVEAEQAILDVLRGARPDDLVVGEESGRTGNDESDRRRGPHGCHRRGRPHPAAHPPPPTVTMRGYAFRRDQSSISVVRFSRLLIRALV